MLYTMDLSGSWMLQLDEEKQGLKQPFLDTMELPGTTSFANKGNRNDERKAGSLTDLYKFEGFVWFQREIEIADDQFGRCVLHLERTRVTTVWIDGKEVGTQNSLCTPHCYDVTPYMSKGKHQLLIRVDNTNYPTKGGHMTSPDTQTNWNGITGRIELQFYHKAHLRNVKLYPDIHQRTVTIRAAAENADGAELMVSALSVNGSSRHVVEEQRFPVEGDNILCEFTLGADALLWSEFEPNVYRMTIALIRGEEVLDRYETYFGMREFKGNSDKFTINGTTTFLRGKHDGLLFPLTGFAPTAVEEWLRVLQTAKSYGINHYRFHTCCPPEAAFVAADLLGIYMEPELPFWGTVTDESYDNHNPAEQNYLIQEGLSILDTFGNHPSFVMMSLGNELWGSKQRINEILKLYKNYDNRRLYTQGSNNFQFTPAILDQEDFFCGVRFSRERLFRGSYAMCDAPLGHVQTDRPSTMKDYDEQIVPDGPSLEAGGNHAAAGEIQIQYGTEARTVQAAEPGEESFVPHIPVVSHEIGQYQTYPNFDEIKKYSGPLKARNLELFKERLAAKGLGHLAESYFEASGKLAVACYKEELEAAFRTRKLAGFQLLDLQDFNGQGTALVGVLDSFMEPKGIVSQQEWSTFCSDAVLLARFEKYQYKAGELFEANIELSYFRNKPAGSFRLRWQLECEGWAMLAGECSASSPQLQNYIDICELSFPMPQVARMTPMKLSLVIDELAVEKHYDLWLYPNEAPASQGEAHVVREWTPETVRMLEKGASVLFMPRLEHLTNSIEGMYCTDFWCYPMFRKISESMNKPIPVGTLGLLIDSGHPVFADFPTEAHSTYPWWSIVMASRSIIMDDAPAGLMPIVQTIDNFERNHKLGLLFECRVGSGRLMVCSSDLEAAGDTLEGRQLFASILNYMNSPAFTPAIALSPEQIGEMIG